MMVRSLVLLSFFLGLAQATLDCASIYDFTGDAGLEAITQVTNATLVAANDTTGVPAYCSVQANVASMGGNTRYVAYLPARRRDWKGTVVQHGCGGSCGNLGLDYVYGYGSGLGYGEDALIRGYAIFQNDMGHDLTLTNDTGSSWNAFRNNRTNEINFAFLSTHLSTVSGKAMIEHFYGKPAERSLFRGGSTGGRQGLIAAARYPHDYDAIITAYGALNETGIGAIQYPYLAQVSMYANRTQILSTADLYALHAGALAACDGNDGLVDGIIDPSYTCEFDPVTILCSNKTLTTDGSCLSSMDKVTAARGMYGWPSNKYSDKLVDGRYIPGSELAWSLWTYDGGVDFAESFTINAAFQQDLPTNWTVAEYNWNKDPYGVAFMEDLYTTDFRGLAVFREKGGKILHYQGWADTSVAPGWNVELYQRTIDELGYNKTISFHRFFMYPGMAHIDINSNVNGTVGWRADYYGYLEKWMDEDIAPESIVVTHWNYTTNATLNTRPYFLYPYTPKYIGGDKGDLNDPGNWKGVIPHKKDRGVDYPWDQ